MKKEKLTSVLLALFFAYASSAQSPTTSVPIALTTTDIQQGALADANKIIAVVVHPSAKEMNPTAKSLPQVKAVKGLHQHEVWNTLLKNNVNAFGKVNYTGMKAALSKIEAYLTVLKENAPQKEWTKNEKLAYWINLYNASTVHLIASNYPTGSITKLKGGKPWDKPFVRAGEQVYSLNQIENEIIRPRFLEPRIHAALNCAAISCPNLLNAAYTPLKLNNQLNQQCTIWVNDGSKNKITASLVEMSPIFQWYAADFKAGGGVVAFLNKYSTATILPKTKRSYLAYDWGLNE